ncbi:hypothetical protein ACSTH7_24960 [Vibrio parahaemolyticus]|uniref:hypothetical protein n=1 Tax=Vibrio parahaemolyticus TaxID=670 RepID=UPI001E3A55A1|nr:hypothetical protein [Vibrio parahaemolyticus]EHH1106350.1 hypothetical protein [Vibrio parahaemolyticus]EHH1935256.1 hypothetical protein [Vibrio parahaemolyticus]EIZ1043116.1 hypothetical protein [Vibrio parahaemolyticus]HCE5137824.1 hypothetical protein [Vibrio parahaemolyticus]
MRVFKVKKGVSQYIKVSENNFIEATKRKAPFYQTVNGEKKHYALCPACENPVILIHLHVDDQFVDENKRSVSMHARHIKKNIPGLADYDQNAYEQCRYANPSSSTSKAQREEGTASANELLELVKTYPDLIDTVIRKSIGLKATESLFVKMVTNFKEEKGHLYRYVTKENLPYAFAYMADSQNLFYASFDTTYQSGRELLELFNSNSKWCKAYKYGRIDRKQEVKDKKQFIDLTFHFTDFDVLEVDEEKYQRFQLVMTEVLDGDSHEILRKEVVFDDHYFMNAVNRRVNYQSLVRTVY